MPVKSAFLPEISVRSQSAVYSRPYSGVSGPGSLEEWKRQLGMCPVALRALLLGDSLEGQTLTCKCSRHRIPFITDIEYDDLIIRYSPPRQLIVVGVTSTMYADSQPAAEMLEKLHTDAARNRCRPCLAARSDATRVLWYDTATAAHSTDHMTPLLLRRHNVVPGMFLMYQGGRLLFCDHIFNGYGNAKKDFQKQIAASQRMADEGHSMPHDFKFSGADFSAKFISMTMPSKSNVRYSSKGWRATSTPSPKASQSQIEVVNVPSNSPSKRTKLPAVVAAVTAVQRRPQSVKVGGT